MQVQVSGHQLDVGDALRSYVTEKLDAAVSKYFDRPGDAKITFSKEGTAYHVECAVHLGALLHMNSRAEGHEIYACFDQAVARMEKQLRRYKRRLKGHSNGEARSGVPAETVPSFVIAATDEEEEVAADAQPVIIAEETTAIPSLSVGDAVMQMDFADVPFVVFRNGKSGGLNLVYRRKDGHIGWIDAAQDRPEAS